jgi:ferredoxin
MGVGLPPQRFESHAPKVDRRRKTIMTYIIAEQLYIDPDECIDCNACVPACPVEAIFAEDDLPEQWSEYLEINANWYQK